MANGDCVEFVFIGFIVAVMAACVAGAAEAKPSPYRDGDDGVRLRVHAVAETRACDEGRANRDCLVLRHDDDRGTNLWTKGLGCTAYREMTGNWLRFDADGRLAAVGPADDFPDVVCHTARVAAIVSEIENDPVALAKIDAEEQREAGEWMAEHERRMEAMHAANDGRIQAFLDEYVGVPFGANVTNFVAVDAVTNYTRDAVLRYVELPLRKEHACFDVLLGGFVGGRLSDVLVGVKQGAGGAAGTRKSGPGASLNELALRFMGETDVRRLPMGRLYVNGVRYRVEDFTRGGVRGFRFRDWKLGNAIFSEAEERRERLLAEEAENPTDGMPAPAEYVRARRAVREAKAREDRERQARIAASRAEDEKHRQAEREMLRKQETEGKTLPVFGSAEKGRERP